MKFAFLILGDFAGKGEKAAVCTGAAQIVAVSDMDAAVTAAKNLVAEGVGCIELCGAFGKDGAQKIIRATGNTVPVGYVTHLPEQDGLFAEAFSK
ncbi:MAG: DUF6506 family protein [Treponema sp.]